MCYNNSEEEDPIQEPGHYKSGSRECIELMKAMSTPEEFEGFLKLNAFKYLYRYNNKGRSIEDLRKSRQYTKALIALKKNPDVVNVFKPES